MARSDHPLRDALLREAHDMLHGGPPTVELLRPVGPDVPSDERVLQVLDLCMQVGEVLLSSGEAGADTSTTMTRLAAACGLKTVDVDITFTSITMCCHRGRAAVPVMSMRILRYRTTDLTRLAVVTRIVDHVVRGQMSLSAAHTAVAEAVSAPHPYPRWVATAGWGGLAAAVASLLGGSVLIAVTAFVVTAVIDRLGRVLSRWGVASFFQQMVGGLVATASTLGLFAIGALPPGTRPSLVIATSITVLLSGVSVMGAVQDAIAGAVVTAAGRATEIALLSAGLLTGVILGLKVGIAFGLVLDPAEPLVVDVFRLGISTSSAAAAAAMIALASYAPLRSLATAALAGGVGEATYATVTQVAHLGPVVSTGLAAVVIGLASTVWRRTRRYRHVIVLCGIVPLLPGLTTYRGFYQLATANVQEGLVTITLALAIGLALAAGVTLGQFLARPRPAPEVPEPAAGRVGGTRERVDAARPPDPGGQQASVDAAGAERRDRA